MKIKLIIILSILIGIQNFSFLQESKIESLEFDIHRVYPPLSITSEMLSEAKTIIDINPYYKSDWIAEYISVSLITIQNGKTILSSSQNDTLSQKQKDQIYAADTASEIKMKVSYIPKNNLKDNESRLIDFSFIIDAEQEAYFPKGTEELRTYISNNAIKYIPDTLIRGYALAAIKFSIDKDGSVVDPFVFESSGDKKIDDLLKEVICNMSDWNPAQHNNGTKVRQDFVLTIGNNESCVMNLLNVKRHISIEEDQ